MRTIVFIASCILIIGCAQAESSSPPVRRFLANGLPANSSTYVILHHFGKGDGRNPSSRLTKSGGAFYGVTEKGGVVSQGECNGGCGVVYALDSSGNETVVYKFTGWSKQGGSDGALPDASLIDVNGTIYGTTTKGGANDLGTVFAIDASGGERIVYSFRGSADGQYPQAGLLNINGTLYGTTTAGGLGGAGTVYAITPSGSESVVYAFAGKDGAGPRAELININGTLYGTTLKGGKKNIGVVFTLTPNGNETVLHSFTGAPDGKFPFSELLDRNGVLYGTTQLGGAATIGPCHAGCGTVYSLTLAGSENIIYNFKGSESGSDGFGPLAGLVEVNGLFYGTTETGGAVNRGTIFVLNASGGETILHSFTG
ncbi:MAG: choice-of-anchor tandem repeat GloVer-containing protein, partial [Candidatus Tumulicola sp.]